MKKTLIFLALLNILLSSCFLPEPPINNIGETYFYLADTNGTSGTTFHSGESFYMKFCLTNTMGDSLDFVMGDGGPFVRFYIYQESQYIAGSTDGLSFILPIINFTFAPGDSMIGTWLAPTSFWQDPIITLSPGEYRALVDFPQFDVLQTDTIEAINFTVIE
ncbi:MAG: hypothetical protein KAU44_05735 [Candidatus Marinimicrobia bacterium]|nr:hypothetical protein [Candidatus Neomarinimicrobiota bacterium]